MIFEGFVLLCNITLFLQKSSLYFLRGKNTLCVVVVLNQIIMNSCGCYSQALFDLFSSVSNAKNSAWQKLLISLISNQLYISYQLHLPIISLNHIPQYLPQTLKYWVGVQWGQSYLMGRRCLFSLGWLPF